MTTIRPIEIIYAAVYCHFGYELSRWGPPMKTEWNTWDALFAFCEPYPTSAFKAVIT